MNLEFANSEGVTVAPAGGRSFAFQTRGADDHVRILLPLPPLEGAAFIDIEAEIRLSVADGLATHVAVINAPVTEGRMIGADAGPGFDDALIAGGVFRAFDGHAILDIPFAGPSRGHISLERVTVRVPKALDRFRRTIKVLFLVDPWTEQGDPLWKSFFMIGYGHHARVLRLAHPGYDLALAGNAALAQALDSTKVVDMPFYGIRDEDLHLVFASARAAHAAWLRGEASAGQTQAMVALLQKTFGGWMPDVIFAHRPASYLAAFAPQALVLHSDGFWFRPPWPDGNVMLEPNGFLRGTLVEDMAKNIADDPGAPDFMQRYRTIIDRDAAPLRARLARDLAAHRARFGRIVVFALQETAFFTPYALTGCGSQIEHVTRTLAAIGPGIGVVMTQHPHHRELSPGVLEDLHARFPNLIAWPRLGVLRSPSQALMPLVDGLVTTSSGLVYMAAIRNKPAFLTHPSHFSALAHTRPLARIDDAEAFAVDGARTDTQMAWMLRHHSFTEGFQYGASWLHDRILRLAAVKAGRALRWTDVPRIAADATILRRLALDLRPPWDSVEDYGG